MFAYIGTEGYLVNDELHEGKQHCQCGTPDFLMETIELCRQITDGKLLFRLDSGNDASENIGILLENGCYFNIKHNLRKEGKESWSAMAKEHCKNISHPRDGKTVYIGSDWRDITYGGEKKKLRYALFTRSLREPQISMVSSCSNRNGK